MTNTTTRMATASVALAGALMLGGCAASGGDSGDGEIELTMTAWGGELDEATYKERLALAEEKFPGVKVKLEMVPEGYDQKLQTRIAGGNAPDIVQLAETVNTYASKGQLIDLAPVFKDADRDIAAEFGETNASIFEDDGALWAAPDRAGAMVLYYNKDLFDAAGVEYPTAQWTWDDWRSAASALTIRDGDTVSQWGFAAGDWWPWYMTFMLQNGGEILDEDGQPVINSSANVDALQFYHDMLFEDRSAPTPRDYANAGLPDGGGDPLFVDGKLGMVLTGFWSVPSYGSVEGLNWGVAPIWQGKEQATPAFFSGLAVTSASKHPEQAARVVEFLTSPEGQLPIAANGEDVPALVEVATSPTFTNPEWLQNDVNLDAFAESAAFTYVPPLVPEWNEITKAFTDNMAATWSGEQSVKDGLDKVQQAVEQIMAG